MDATVDRHMAALMMRAQDGDRRAYEALLVEVATLVRAFARARMRDGVEDVVQDTLLAIHRARHTYDPARPFGPWMYAIARHRLVDAARQQRRRNATEVLGRAGLGRADVGVPDTVAERVTAASFLRCAMTQLSRAQREVIALLKLEDRSIEEISRRTGLSVAAVKVTAHRGYKKLRKLAGDDD